LHRQRTRNLDTAACNSTQIERDLPDDPGTFAGAKRSFRSSPHSDNVFPASYSICSPLLADCGAA
jgi:hypothetical protein